MTITENVKKFKSELGPGVHLVAATKMNDAARIREAIAAGVEICGENRVQELLEKLEQNAYEGSRLHFIGHLQKNKAKYIVGKVELIQSVDTLELIDVIGALASRRGIVQDILLEINIAAEPSKSGFAPDEIYAALDYADKVSGVHVRGLMSVPPICSESVQNRPYFEHLKQLFIDISTKKYDNNSMDFLSAGMSGDYLEAVECGSNMVRIGSAIFGPRDYSKH